MRWSCSLCISLGLLAGCRPEPPAPGVAFYHWETRLQAADSTLRSAGAERLYIKVFDVGWKDGKAQPAALLEADSLPRDVESVPVVFITNEVFTHSTDELAGELLGLLARRFPGPYPELQIDCDWTAGTRDAYFAFLERLRELAAVPVSCTVRLHQYRDREQQGIPPVDRVVLMAYNTGDLDRWDTENSILDPAIVDDYVEATPPYPLPLDLAVPAYDWAVVYRRDRLAYLINEPPLEELSDSSRFTRLSPTRYRVARSTYYGNLYLYQDDRLRLEAVTRREAESIAADLWPRIAHAGSRYIIYYRIGSRQWR